MRLSVRISDPATHDIEELALFLLLASGDHLADRFVEAVYKASQSLARHPRRGHISQVQVSAGEALRVLGVEGFPNVRLYYRVDKRAVHIVRVIHAARDVTEDYFSP